MTDDDLCYLPATEALRRFRSRELSPTELMQAVIARAEAVEPTVNALCFTFFDRALEAAAEAERRYAGSGPPPRALEGLPVAIKDEVPIEGDPNTGGSLLSADEIADTTSPMAERILDAGGIAHARTTTPEFSCACYTHSDLWGVTRNPWNPEWSVGGSSGGSGAALASGTATLATGSDIAGSIRIPASANGVVGFKPPFGRVPADPPYSLDQYCHDGPMARTVADCALFENVIAGPHPRDVVSLRPKLELPSDPGSIEGWTIGLSLTLGDYPIDPDVERNTLAAAQAFRDAGAEVIEVAPDIARADVLRATYAHLGLLFGAEIERSSKQEREHMTAYAIDIAERSSATLREIGFEDGLMLEAKVWDALAPILERVDVMICPTMASRGFVAGDDYVGHGIEVGGVHVDDYAEALMTPVFNIASRCPVLAVPSGVADNGVPTGIQIVGKTYDDASVFQAAAAYERVLPWLDVPERRPAI